MIKYLLHIVMLLVSTISFAQNGLTGKGETKINLKEIKLDSTERVYSPAKQEVEIQKEEVKKITFNYEYQPQVQTKNITSKVAIYRLKITSEDDSKNGFVKAGMGNYTATLLDVYYGSNANSKLSWSVGVNHLGALNGPVDKRASGYSDNKLFLKGKYFLNNYLISAGATYRRNVTRNYGYLAAKTKFDSLLTDTTFYTESQKNAAQDLSFDINLKSLNQNSPLKFELNVVPSFFRLNDSLSEIDLFTQLTPSYELQSGKIKLDVYYKLNQIKDTLSISRNLIHLKPSFEYSSDDKRLWADVGVILNTSSDSTLVKNVSFYPYLKGSYLVSQDYNLFLKGELSGGLNQMSLKRSFRNNLWINQFIPNTENEKIRIIASLEASPMENLTAKLKLKYASIDNFNFYSSDSLDLSYYKNTYSKTAVSLVSPGFELNYKLKNGHGINADFTYNAYTAEEELFYTPSLISNVEMYYKVKNNLKISSDILYISGLVGDNPIDQTSNKLSNIFDLNLKFDFEFNDKLGLFLYGNNLLNNKYEYFNYYPVQGLNILAGLKLGF